MNVIRNSLTQGVYKHNSIVKSHPETGFVLSLSGTLLKNGNHATFRQEKKRKTTAEQRVLPCEFSTESKVAEVAQVQVSNPAPHPSTLLLCAITEICEEVQRSCSTLPDQQSQCEEASCPDVAYDSGILPLMKETLNQLTGVELRHWDMQPEHVYVDACSSVEAGGPLVEGERSSLSCLSLSHLFLRLGEQGLVDLSRITMLDLEVNRLGSAGVTQLCVHFLPALPQLRRLHLATNQIGIEGLNNLVRFSVIHPLEQQVGGVKGTDAEEKISRAKRALPLEVLGLTNNPLSTSSDPSGSLSSTPSLHHPVDHTDNSAAIQWESVSSGCGIGNTLAVWLHLHSSTVRRLHLNHVGLTTEDAVQLLGKLLFGTSAALENHGGGHTLKQQQEETISGTSIGTAFPAWDMLYMKQNPLVNTSDVMNRILRGAKSVQEESEIAAWVKKHVLW